MNLSKTIFLRLKFLERLDNFFRLTFSCIFSILSRWLLTLINQFKFTFLGAITPQKLSIKQNNCSQSSSSSKSQHFLSISGKFASHFLSKFSDVHPPRKNFSLPLIPLALNKRLIYLQKHGMVETFIYQFRFLETCFHIIVTLLIHLKRDLAWRIIYQLCMPFLKMSHKRKYISKILSYILIFFESSTD